jgi:hypothetical protein
MPEYRLRLFVEWFATVEVSQLRDEAAISKQQKLRAALLPATSFYSLG